jgi:hypothetical protein
MPKGWLNDAAVPVPSAKPAVPEPANVVTSPAGVILRMTLPTDLGHVDGAVGGYGHPRRALELG